MFRRCTRWFAPSVEDVHAAYRVMGLPSGAPQDLVRTKYRELARTHHPDLSSGDDTTMKVVNTAYELLQSHSSLVASASSSSSATATSSPTASPDGSDFQKGRFNRRTLQRKKILSDLTNSDTWATSTDMDWQMAMNDISDRDLKNPANHPYSFSKFYSFEDDATIYRMIRTGASVAEVGRVLGKPATFIEKRLNNAQFKQRVQILLRKEKHSLADKDRVDLSKQTTRRHERKHWDDMSYEERGQHAGVYPTEPTAGKGVPEWSAQQVTSRIGRSYANFERFHRGSHRSSSPSFR